MNQRAWVDRLRSARRPWLLTSVIRVMLLAAPMVLLAVLTSRGSDTVWLLGFFALLLLVAEFVNFRRWRRYWGVVKAEARDQRHFEAQAVLLGELGQTSDRVCQALAEFSDRAPVCGVRPGRAPAWRGEVVASAYAALARPGPVLVLLPEESRRWNALETALDECLVLEARSIGDAADPAALRVAAERLRGALPPG